ncbi:hypothetical protein E3P99_03282 [Wallemia hederae]|uniref:Wax synthase domain-containing protein n=1 Tax=Wallemia hederae TaxID=1540922 RepID=A0A4T0FGR3_9BASI|nr:hypothetical protein E3P99_03282 [Wallemia hederae]
MIASLLQSQLAQDVYAVIHAAPTIPVPSATALLVLPLQARLLVAKPSRLNVAVRVVLLFAYLFVAVLGERISNHDKLIIGFCLNLIVSAGALHSVHLTFTNRRLIDAPKIISFSHYGYSDLGWSGAVEMLFNFRGIGMGWGVSDENLRPYDRFIWSALYEMLTQHVVSQLAFAAMARFGAHNHGKTLYELVGCDVAITIALFAFVVSSCSLVYTSVSLLVYIISALLQISFDERRWAPLFSNPLKSDSVTAFWNERWHGLLQRHAYLCGYRPVYKALTYLQVPGDVPHYSAIIGTYAVSGAMYEYCLRCTSGALLMYGSYPTFNFFIISALAIILEHGVVEYSGRRVGSLCGRIWTCVILFIPALHMARQVLLAMGPMQDPAEWAWWRWLLPLSFALSK